MNKKLKNQVIKVPNNIEVFYSQEKKTIIFRGPAKQRSLKINNLLTIFCKKQELEIAADTTVKLSKNAKKRIQAIKRTTASLIKQLLIESVALVYQKLRLVGVGYRIFPVEGFESHLLLLKLGYSHPIYFKISKETEVFNLKLTKLFLYSHSYQQLTLTASQIRKNKIPEPYKGKGILYENEKIVLKEGKKI